MVRGDLEAVVINCPNAKFDLFCPGSDCLEYFRIIGERLDRIWFDDCLKSIDNLSDFREIWDLCPSIRSLDSGRCTEPCEVRAILNTPKPLLKHLHLGFDDYKALDVFAEGRTSLESIIFSYNFPPENAFNSLVANYKALREVQI